MAKVPKQAKKVFEGILFDVFHWDQELFDGSKATFEMISRFPSVLVIAIVGEKIVVLMEEQPNKPLFPSIPGGKIEEGHTSLETAKKELLEETGYEAKEWSLYKEWFGSSKIYHQDSLFIAKGCSKVSEQSLDSGEKIEIKYYTFEQFLELCRNERFAVPFGMRIMMYEALLDETKKEQLRKDLFS